MSKFIDEFNSFLLYWFPTKPEQYLDINDKNLFFQTVLLFKINENLEHISSKLDRIIERGNSDD